MRGKLKNNYNVNNHKRKCSIPSISITNQLFIVMLKNELSIFTSTKYIHILKLLSIYYYFLLSIIHNFYSSKLCHETLQHIHMYKNNDIFIYVKIYIHKTFYSRIITVTCQSFLFKVHASVLTVSRLYFIKDINACTSWHVMILYLYLFAIPTKLDHLILARRFHLIRGFVIYEYPHMRFILRRSIKIHTFEDKEKVDAMKWLIVKLFVVHD